MTKRGFSEEEEEERLKLPKLAMDVPGIQRYLVGIEYIGTRFSGWQRQEGVRTVQGTLEDAFSSFMGQSVSTTGSSRTDAGVHALRNVFHVDLARTSKRKPGELLAPHPPDVIVRAVNHFLQRESADVQVVDARFVPPDFHARFRAKERTYYYRILAGSCRASLFERDRAWHVEEPLNLIAMQSACQVLLGTHDFSSFRASGCQAASPVKTLEELSIRETVSWPHLLTGCSSNAQSSNPDLKSYVVTARAQSFLYHQVRLMVGTLKGVGAGKRTAEDVRKILEGRSISLALPMAPASGLFLADVKYDMEDTAGLRTLSGCGSPTVS
ncbi:uncharacterized protein LOC9657083 isoform X1 [Selaginella moellendorffii]|uniref:uncharacterized protein LOC9657083 isoform X1 n=1 Tax=Selaginella moellendorffii TaxID=88036 RepID=UPI000D1CF3DE|nr:uncharacterized protein LOC9657083 isoform X1 [Selaginella moellendorffii]|eukprot:XP_002974164.2 uncharacterized protein LOC9657083 isoform X1 [Selaginella moellendorffii]